MAKTRILFIGPACVCFEAETPYIPAPGELIPSSGKYSFAPGGHAFLSAAASARLGGDPAICCAIGNDYYGDRIKDICTREQIHVSGVCPISGEQTGIRLRLTEKDGTTRRILFPAAGGKLEGKHAENAFACYPDAVVVSSSCPDGVLIQASEEAAARHIPFVVDEDPDGRKVETLPLEKLQDTALLIVNESEDQGEPFTGREERQKAACYALYKRANVRSIVMRLGSKGCFLYDGKYFSLVSAPDSEVVDPDGVAPAFSAAFVGEFLAGGDLLRSSQNANAVSAFVASRKGGFASLPERK